MATLWHVGDVIELICEFDDSPTHLTTLRRVSWSFHRAVENVWTLLLGRQNSVIADEQLNSIAQRYGATFCVLSRRTSVVRAVRAALTALRHTLTSFVCRVSGQPNMELVAQLVDMPQLQSVKLLQKESVFELTAQFGTAAQLEALVHRCPHLLVNSSGNSSLIFTARSGNLGCALVLLQHGCDINAKAVNGNMIAHIACEHGHHEYLEGLIIDAGYDVDLNARTGMFGTPAHMAVCQPSTLQFLVDRGANVDLVSAGLYSGTPAFVAASVGAAESLRILLAAGAVLNGTYIPLVLAAWEHPACLDVLGNAGVDLDVVNCAGETAAHHAARDGQLESLRTLHKHGANMFAVSRAGRDPRTARGAGRLH
jgi:hypothetical protein